VTTLKTTLTVRDTIERNLADEPQTIVRVYETSKLRTDLVEYVLTDQLAREFAKVVERVVDSARPTGGETDKVGVWVSGFFGSGKSHFAKLAGHLLADTEVGGGERARELFGRLLHPGRPADERLRELFQQARTYRLACHLAAFDIMAQHSAIAERNVGLTFLRAFYESLGLSKVIAFAERELELQAAGKHQAFVALFEQKSGVSWDEEKDLASSSALVAECLAELMPDRYRTTELAHQSLQLAMREVEGHLTIDGVVDRLLRWLDARQKQVGQGPQRLVFVADEVGAWAGRNQDRIEQIRALIETLATKGQGRIWLIATSQERLSAVVQNASIADSRAAQQLLQRLEARFQTNVHLESSEVGTVIEDRILRKRPTAVPVLEQRWHKHEQQLRDIAEPPGLELGANYPRADREPFVKDYPFLPYQLQAAADIFGGMRGVRVSSGARSMIGVAFDALRTLADRPVGNVVSWDQIFDSANRDNEFADEQYLGSQGLEYIRSADRDVLGAPIIRHPSRLLKALWLAQQTARIPRTPRNLARLLVDSLETDVLQLEREVKETLAALEQRNFVRREAATGQWKFLTQDEVTVEKIVRRIAEDIKHKDVRDAVFKEYAEQLQKLFNGRIAVGKSNTAFDYGVYLNAAPIKNDKAPVKLRVELVASAGEARKIAEESAAYLDAPEVRWVLQVVPGLEDRLRRALAIERLENDEEYRRIATERTRAEAAKLRAEADELRRNAAADVERAFQGGTLYWAGNELALEPVNAARAGRGGPAASARTKVEEALRDRIAAHYYRFAEGDRTFSSANVEKIFTVAAADRAALDPDLGLFGPEGHVHGNHVLVEELTAFLKSSTRTAGQDVTERFGDAPYGWPADLLRYVAAAMFVDGKLSAIDRAGKRYDDPKAAGARALFGTAAFKTTRLEVEEEALTPEESSQARALLTELGHAPSDGGEVALKEATLQLTNSLAKRLAVLEKARQVGLPLPASYETIPTTLEAIGASASRVKIVRALLAHAQPLRDAAKALDRLEDFDKRHGFDQYRRSQELLAAALQAGLADDPKQGPAVQAARDELEALRAQARVLDEWDGAYRKYRLDVLDAFKAVYVPLREELHQKAAEARRTILEMPEFEALSFGDRDLVRVEYLGEGKPLQEVSLPELRDEQQLLAANAEYSLAHLRAALAALESQVAQARARVIELHSEGQRRKGEQERIALWKPAEAFAGKRFATEADVDAAFDPEKERLKALVREGKTVQVV
jgi:hypothetical protein